MDSVKIGFLGYGTRALDVLMADGRFDVKYFLAPKPRLCKDVFDSAERYKNRVELEIIENKKVLLERVKEINDVECFVMNACPFILTGEILDNMDFYNIHPGSLYTNRGHQPHLWTVLLGERETSIAIHKVNTNIDDGYVIEEVKIKLTGKENSFEVLNLAEDQIPVLLTGLYKYLKGEKVEKYFVHNGEYRSIMTYSDYEIKENDSIDNIDRKIRARFMRNGAFFERENKRIYVDKILSCCESRENKFEYNNESAVYCHNGFKAKFSVKKITDLEGNIIYIR